MADNNSPQPISKIRTFKQDYERIKGASATTAKPKEVTPPTIVKPKTDSAAVQVRNREYVPMSSLHTDKPKVITPQSTFKKPVTSKVPTTTEKPANTPEVAASAPTPASEPEAPKTASVDTKLSAEVNKHLDTKTPVGGFSTVPDSPQVGGDITAGNIITDTKKHKVRLLPAIWRGIKGWFVESKEDIREQLEPKEKVIPGATRKDVVTHAASVSSLAPHDDYEKVSERLRHTERIESDGKPVSIKDRDEVAAPTWSHIEEGGSVADEPVPNPAPVVEPEVIPVAEEPAAATTPAPEVVQPAPVPEVTEPETVPEPKPQIIEPEPVAPTTTPAPVAPEPSRPRIAFGSTIGQQATKRILPDLSIPLITAAIVISVIAGISLSIWLLRGDDETVVTDQTSPSTNLVASGNNITVPLGVSRTALLQSIANNISGANAIVATIYPTHNAGPATVDEILEVLDWRAPGAFLRNISELSFGSYQGQSPFIVMKVSSFETGYGGMLTWEDDMSSDLAPLFGQTVTNTFDATARTNTQTRPAFFVDKTVGVLDVRLLKDEQSADRIAYTFIDQNTILITDSLAALEEIVPYIK